MQMSQKQQTNCLKSEEPAYSKIWWFCFLCLVIYTLQVSRISKHVVWRVWVRFWNTTTFSLIWIWNSWNMAAECPGCQGSLWRYEARPLPVAWLAPEGAHAAASSVLWPQRGTLWGCGILGLGSCPIAWPWRKWRPASYTVACVLRLLSISNPHWSDRVRPMGPNTKLCVTSVLWLTAK